MMRAMSNGLRTALIVDDDLDLQAALGRMLRRRGLEKIFVATGATGAIAYAHSDVDIDVVLLDIHLGDGNGVDVCKAFATRRPAPRIVAVSGLATALEGFALARMGVRTFLQKPVSEAILWDAISSTSGLDLAVAAISMVGAVPLRKAQASVRQAMVEEAFARAGGNLTQAALLLGVTRQAVRSALATLAADDDPPLEGHDDLV
jgi:two-component system response regulator RegA